jgi:hypothetical protein
VQYIARHRTQVKLQADQKLLFKGDWEKADVRLKAVRDVVIMLAELAASGRRAA